MTDRPPLSKGEMEIARVIWRLGRATVGQVYDALPKRRRPDYTTVQTYIRRLENKGYLRSQRDGRNKVYSAKVRPGTVIREAVDDFMERLFDGELVPFMKHLINDRGIDEQELAALRRLLEPTEESQDDVEHE